MPRINRTAPCGVFPAGLAVSHRPGRRIHRGAPEPIAADAREDKDGKVNAKLKLIAGVLGVDFDALKQRENKEGGATWPSV